MGEPSVYSFSYLYETVAIAWISRSSQKNAGTQRLPLVLTVATAVR